MSAASDRHVAVLTVHHVHADGHNYTGGAEKYILLAIETLLQAGVRVQVGYSGTDIYEPVRARWRDQIQTDCVNWLDQNLAGDGDVTRNMVSKRQNWFVSNGVDTTFFVQQASGAAFQASVVAARSLGLRVVSTIRQSPGEVAAPRKNWRDTLPFSWRRRAINKVRIPALCSDLIIFNSARVADAYQRMYAFPAEICRVIYNGELPRPKRIRPKDLTSQTVGTVGRISNAKGADLLLEAFAKVASELPQARLVYFGDGPDSLALRNRIADLKLDDRVRLAGFVDDRDAIFSGIDIYVQASRRESMSNSVLEAMARGIPCIVTDVGGLPELVVEGVTGRVVPPESVALATAIRELLKDPYTCRQYGEAGLKRVAETFNLERFRVETLHAILG